MEPQKKKWIGLLAFIGIPVVGAAFYLAMQEPKDEHFAVHAPPLALPNPNGYDQLIAELDRFPKVVLSRFPIYRSRPNNDDPKRALPDSEAEVAKFQLDLAKIETVLDQPFQAPYPLAAENLERMHAAASVGKVLCARAFVDRERGRIDDAYHSLFLAWKLGDLWATTDAMGGDQITGQVIKGVARREIDVLLLTKPPSNVAPFLAMLEESLQARSNFRTVMIREIAEFQNLCEKELNGPDWRTRLIAPLSPSQMTESQKTLYRRISRESYYLAGLERRQEALQYANEPFHQPVHIMTTTTDAHEIAGDSCSDLLFSYTWGQWEFDRAYDLLLVHILALELYKREHGEYPAKLSELTPEILKIGYADPFGLGKPLAYRRDGDKFVLFSVGPDGIDNGGSFLELPDGSYMVFGSTKLEMLGDITWPIRKP
ncbi:MAG: hypothetical protein KF784_14480 [Fimbriimonadaceae bacterium]|nr:hypothetical protein [Fimbriimonadaceae bacterium]